MDFQASATLDVTDGPTGAGTSFGYATPTAAVMLANMHQGLTVEYKVNDGSWVRLDGSAGVELQLNMAADMLRVRRTTLGGGAITVGLLTKPRTVAGPIFQAYHCSNITALGDSIAQQNSNAPADGSCNKMARGPVAYMLAYLGQPWDFQPSDNFAVFGSTMEAILYSQLPAMLAANKTRRYTRAFISCLTNDANILRPIGESKELFLKLVHALRDAGIIPVHTGVRPRGTDIAMTAQKRMNAQLNEWLYQLSAVGLIEFIDSTGVYADNSTAFGNALTALMYDSGTNNLHPGERGACLEGRLMADYYAARGVAPQLHFALSQSDVFDRTENPQGVAFKVANPTLQGGTTAPTGMLTGGGTWSKVTRALPNGQTRSDPSCVLAASTVHYLFDDWTATGAFAVNEPQPGEIYEARAKVVVASGVNLKSVTLRGVTSDGVTSKAYYDLFAGATASLPDGDHVLYLKTPRFVIPPYAGTGNASVFARAECETLAGGAGTFGAQAFELRKVG
jgi:lysophospholipase L1-like esterase